MRHHATAWPAIAALCAGLLATACADDGPDRADGATQPPSSTVTASSATTASGATTTTDSTSSETTEPDEGPAGGPTQSTTTSTTTSTTLAPSEREVAMTIALQLDPAAVWEDGTPITVADLECTWRAFVGTPGSVRTSGYDQIVGVRAGGAPGDVVIELATPYAAYKTLFDRVIKAAAVADCDDVSADFATALPVAGGRYVLQSWDAAGGVLVPNPLWWGADPATAQVAVVPQPDRPTELASVVTGAVDYIYPQFGDDLGALVDPNVQVDLQLGGDVEALWFQQRDGPFADDVFREAFSRSIDRAAVFTAVYGGEAGIVPAECGPTVPGPYCPPDSAQQTFDPAAAAALLTDAGWAREDGGFWSRDGVVPQIRFVINDGNARRARAQEYLIPLLAEAGFDVVADNGSSDEVFEQRLPSLDYDLTMYATNAAPDPSSLTSILSCAQVPSEANAFQGANWQGWCDEDASAALEAADRELDEQARAELVQSAVRATAIDSVLLPLAQLPEAAAWRSDRLGGPVGAETANQRAFAANLSQWEDLDGDGQIVIGAEQWPTCLNPVTQCSDSSWYLWTVAFPVLPSIWTTTAARTFEPTELVVAEPVVELPG